MYLNYHTPYTQAVFFDRDGTLIVDRVHLSDPAGVALMPGAGAVLAALRKACVLCFVLSNQSGVGRGLMWLSDVMAVNNRLDQLLWEEHQALIHRYFLCLHRPEEHCACRKPSPLLLNQAVTLYGLDPKRCWMVGDRESDMEAGRRAGMKSFFLGYDTPPPCDAHGALIEDFMEIALKDSASSA